MPGGIPICVYVPELKLFRVEYAKGKCFSSGGYGVSMVRTDDDDDKASQPTTKADNSLDEKEPLDSKTESCQYLFLEEALFMYERGLLEVHFFKEGKCNDSSRLYNMLNASDVSLAIYLVYAHLRAQSYVVVRHTARRLELVQQVQTAAQASDTSRDATSWKKKRKATGASQARRQLKMDAWNAPSPKVVTQQSCVAASCNDSMIAFDVYQPNSSFRKTNPGPPDFYVAVTNFAVPSIPMRDLKRLVESCHGIPLRIATVADSGAVVMFGLSNHGVPDMMQNETAQPI